MHTIEICLPLPPSKNVAKGYGQGRVYETAAAKDFKRAVALACRQARVQPVAGPYSLRVELTPASARYDLPNALDILSDALIGCATLDDNEMVDLEMHRLEPNWGQAGVWVRIRAERLATADELAALLRRRATQRLRARASLGRRRVRGMVSPAYTRGAHVRLPPP